jgi:hypothetical protein
MTDEATTLAVVDDTSSAVAAGVAEAQSDGDILDLNTQGDDGQAHDADGQGGEGEGAVDGTATNADLAEVEHEGQKFQVPAQLKDSFLRWADYTQKTEALGQQRRALEAQAAQFEQVTGTVNEKQVDLAMIDRQLAVYKNLPWRDLIAEDPVFAAQERAAYDELKDRRETVADELESAKRNAALESERVTASRLQEGLEKLAKDIPGWGAELAGKLVTFGAENYGFSLEELNEVKDPRLVRILHAAYTGSQALKQQREAQRIRQGQNTAPAAALRGNGGRYMAEATTNDFAAFERLADARMK